MSGMNKTMHDVAYALLIREAGEQCARCKKKKPDIKRLIVDHIDNDKKNNPADGSNWQLLCDACNVRKRLQYKARKKRSSSKFNKIRRVKRSLTPIPIGETLQFRTAQMKKNSEAELPCRGYLERKIKELQPVQKTKLLNATANWYTKMTEARGCPDTISVETVGNYLAKMTQDINGDFEEGTLDDHVVVRKREATQHEH